MKEMDSMPGMHKIGAAGKLIIMIAVSFVVMYGLMYAMVDKLDNALPNVNTFYMATLMTSAMVLIELAVMRGMYPKKTQVIGAALGVLVLVASFASIRFQTGVSDKAFLESMIPHHASALLMCGQADLHDAEVQALCQRIMSGQQSEIDWMKQKLSTLK